jgi:hypothetical protein
LQARPNVAPFQQDIESRVFLAAARHVSAQLRDYFGLILPSLS